MRGAVNHLKKSDPVMRAIIERVGPCRMEFGPPEFHSLAKSIVYQQLNGGPLSSFLSASSRSQVIRSRPIAFSS
jgi:hypothetical protein